MEPIGFIAYTAFLITMSGIWFQSECVPKNDIRAEKAIKIDDSVYQCTEDQRLIHGRKVLKYKKMECEGNECD